MKPFYQSTDAILSPNDREFVDTRLPQDTDWLDGDSDTCPKPDRGEVDRSDEVRDNEL